MEICHKIHKIYRPKIRSFVYSVGMLFLFFFRLEVHPDSRWEQSHCCIFLTRYQTYDFVMPSLVVIVSIVDSCFRNNHDPHLFSLFQVLCLHYIDGV